MRTSKFESIVKKTTKQVFLKTAHMITIVALGVLVSTIPEASKMIYEGNYALQSHQEVYKRNVQLLFELPYATAHSYHLKIPEGATPLQSPQLEGVIKEKPSVWDYFQRAVHLQPIFLSQKEENDMLKTARSIRDENLQHYDFKRPVIVESATTFPFLPSQNEAAGSGDEKHICLITVSHLQAKQISEKYQIQQPDVIQKFIVQHELAHCFFGPKQHKETILNLKNLILQDLKEQNISFPKEDRAYFDNFFSKFTTHKDISPVLGRTFGESFSDTFAALQMIRKNWAQTPEKTSLFLEQWSDMRSHAEGDIHHTTPALLTLKAAYEEDPERLQKMSEEETFQFAKEIALRGSLVSALLPFQKTIESNILDTWFDLLTSPERIDKKSPRP